MTSLISFSPDAGSFRDTILVFILLCGVFFACRVKVCKSSLLYLLLWFEALVATSYSVYSVIERNIITYLLFAIITIMFCNLKFKKKDICCFINIYVYIALICAILIILSWIMEVPHSWNRYSIGVIGVTKNPNYINDIILLASAFLIYKMVVFKKCRFIYSVFLGVFLFAIILTGTRAALLTFVGIVLISLIYMIGRGKNIKNIFLIFLLIILVIGVMLFIAPDDIKYRFLRENAFTDNLRLYMWKMGFEQFKSFPIFGMGINGATAYNSTLNLSVTNIHNVLLQFVYEQGIVGVVIFIILLFNIIRRTKKHDKFLIVLMFFSLYFPILFQNGLVAFTFWWPLVVLEVVSRVSEREGINKNE